MEGVAVDLVGDGCTASPVNTGRDREIDDIFTGADDPPLATVCERGERALVEAWLARKFDQWVVVRPRLGRSRVAEPADRFAAATRRVGAVLAFGQLEYLAKRWLRVGWAVDREICLRTLTDSWCHLLAQDD
jgi:hypothetical protein